MTEASSQFKLCSVEWKTEGYDSKEALRLIYIYGVQAIFNAIRFSREFSVHFCHRLTQNVEILEKMTPNALSSQIHKRKWSNLKRILNIGHTDILL